MSIVINELSKTYKTGRNPEVHALRGVSFTLPEKGLVFILGKSGCGKSTLLNVLGGLDGFDNGDIIVNGKSMKGFSAKDYDNYRNNCVGFVFQENNLLEQNTVKRNVGLALDLQKERDGAERTNEALDAVGLKDFADRRCNRLSGGQKQRVAIARAIVKKPEILLCDEPTGSLDSETGKDIFDLLKKISEDTLVAVVSHDRESAEKYGDRIIEIKDGQILSDSNPLNGEIPYAEKKTAKKNGLPFKRALTMGAGYLIARPVRLVLSVLICLITVTGIGIADTFSAFDRDECVAENISFFATSHMNYRKQLMVNDKDSGGLKHVNDLDMSKSDVENLKNFVKSSRYDYCYKEEVMFKQNYFQQFDTTESVFSIGGIAEIDSSLPTDYGFELYGSYPRNENEIVITKHTYKGFELFGYSNQTKITGYEDLIGKTLTLQNERLRVQGENYWQWSYDAPETSEYKVVGILDTKVNEERYGEYLYTLDPNAPYRRLPLDFPAGMDTMISNGMHSTVFFCSGFIENVYLPKAVRYVEYYYGEYLKEKPTTDNVEVISSVYTPIEKNYKTLLSCVTVYKRSAEPYVNDNGVESGFVGYDLDNDVSTAINWLNQDMILYKRVLTWVSVGMIVVAALFLLYFISGIISDKKREIGVLRALGASRGDILKIFGAENGIFAVCIILIATALSAVGAVLINAQLLGYYKTSAILLRFGIRQFFVLAAVAIGAVLLGIAIPIIKLLRAKPVDIIAERK